MLASQAVSGLYCSHETTQTNKIQNLVCLGLVRVETGCFDFQPLSKMRFTFPCWCGKYRSEQDLWMYKLDPDKHVSNYEDNDSFWTCVSYEMCVWNVQRSEFDWLSILPNDLLSILMHFFTSREEKVQRFASQKFFGFTEVERFILILIDIERLATKTLKSSQK